jgi:MinD superfamily P-loop ATPase
VLGLAAHFGIQSLVCINKADLYPAGTDTITGYCQENGLPMLGQLPFDLSITEAMVHGQTITAYLPDSPASRVLREIWQGILTFVYEQPAVK